MFGDAWAARKGSWKLIGKGEAPLTLVNLENDLPEKNNLMKEKAELADELLKLHRKWVAEVGDQ
jgi:hypothetical protein